MNSLKWFGVGVASTALCMSICNAVGIITLKSVFFPIMFGSLFVILLVCAIETIIEKRFK